MPREDAKSDANGRVATIKLMSAIDQTYVAAGELPSTDYVLEEAGGDDFRNRSRTWLGELHGSFSALARILSDGMHVATGVAVNARDVGFAFDETVVLTVRHAGDDATSMEVVFDGRWPEQRYQCSVLWHSPVSQLDVSVLRLRPAATYLPLCRFERALLPVAREMPKEWFALPGGGHRRQRFYVLSYAAGREAGTPMENNLFLGSKARSGTRRPVFLYYRGSTAKGSSGGAILDEELQLVGLHRAAAATLHDGVTPDRSVQPMREGISIQSVREEISGSVGVRSVKRSAWTRILELFE